MPAESIYPPFEVPNVDLWDFILERKDREFSDDKELFIDAETKRSYTFATVKSTAFEFGKGLRALWDWKKGDVLAVFSPNSIDFPPIVWGTHWAGGVISPANPTYTVKELAYQLKDCGARALVTQKPFLPIAIAAAKEAGIEEDMIILMGDGRDPDAKFKHFTSIRNISGAARYRKAKINPSEDIAFLAYSSGTTGLPKGVMLTHTNISSNTLMNVTGESNEIVTSGGRVLAFLPFFHIYGLTCLIHHGAYRGLQLVVMAKFDLERFCQLVQEHKITYVYLVPPIVLALTKHPIVAKYDLSSIVMANSGAAPLTKELVEGIYDRLKLKVKQGYGLSETSPTTHVQRWEDWQTGIGSVGPLLANQTAKYVDSEEKEVPAGQVGELWVKGPNVFKGYWKNQKATDGCMTPDGYFKTGDIGYQDKNGNFYITDRIKELIKYKGFQVPPAELEGLMLSHTSIADVGVIGIYNKEEATEVPRAYVVLAPGAKESEKEIIDWVTSKVAHHKRLRGGVRFVKEIPKSVSGKLLRRVLKEQAAKEG